MALLVGDGGDQQLHHYVWHSGLPITYYNAEYEGKPCQPDNKLRRTQEYRLSLGDGKDPAVWYTWNFPVLTHSIGGLSLPDQSGQVVNLNPISNPRLSNSNKRPRTE